MENFFEMFYRGLIIVGGYSQHFILLFLRVIWGFLLYGIGTAKLNNIDPVIAFFGEIGIPYPVFSAYMIGLLEFIGGTCLLVGFASRLFALPIAISMFVAMLTAHRDTIKMFFHDPLQTTRIDPFSFLLVALIVFAFGPGAFSIDAIIKRRYM